MFTVRDLALLSSRWSRPASERAPSPQSPALFLFSLLSSLPLPLFCLHLIFHSDPISSSSFPFSFHLLLPSTLSITVSYFSPLTLPSPLSHVPCCFLSAQLLYFCFFPLCPPLSPIFLSLCIRMSKRRKCYKVKPDHWEGVTDSTSPPDPWSLCSVELPLETLVIQILHR